MQRINKHLKKSDLPLLLVFASLFGGCLVAVFAAHIR